MNCYNRRLSDISDVFRTFIGHTYWHLLGVSGDYLAVGKSNERDANVANCEKGNEKVTQRDNESNDWEMKMTNK